MLLLLLGTQGCLENAQKHNLQIIQITISTKLASELAGENITNTSTVLEEAVTQITESSAINETDLEDVSVGESAGQQPTENQNPSLFEFNATASIHCNGTICTDKTLNGRALISIDIKRLYAEMNNLDAVDTSGNYRLTGSMKSAATNDRLPNLAEANLVFSYDDTNITLDSTATLFINASQAEQEQVEGLFIASRQDTGLEFIGSFARELEGGAAAP